MKKDETLLDNFLRIAKQQGGTIHQFVDITASNFDTFQKLYNDYTNAGISFNCFKGFKKLADRCNFWGVKF